MRNGTYIFQKWEIADGTLKIAISTDQPLDRPAYESLQALVDAIETFVYANQPIRRPEDA